MEVSRRDPRKICTGREDRRRGSQSNLFATGKRSHGILFTFSQEMAKPLLLSCTTMLGGGLADV